MTSLQKNESFVVEIKAVGMKKIVVPVETFEQASKLVTGVTSFHNLGASKFKSAIIFHPTKGGFAHVSYNGRIWEGTNTTSFNRTEIKF